jgi:hypothetical protein
MGTRDLDRSSIEVSAARVLARYVRKFGWKPTPPVPVEEIMECLLDYQIVLEDTETLYGVPDVLGAIDLKQRQVIIDESLDPSTNPRKEGRYLFTLGHEIGHLEMHIWDFPRMIARRIVSGRSMPPIVCRQKSWKDLRERQAELFSSDLLMPVKLVQTAWEEMTGSIRSYWATEEICYLLEQRFGYPVVKFSETLSRVFRTSGQAMQIRLIELGLIKIEYVNLPPGTYMSRI